MNKMRFKEFLNETPSNVQTSWQTKEPSKDEIIKWLVLCGEMLEQGRPLFRGDSRIKEPTIVYPSTGRRKSTSTPLYQWMMDCSLALKDYPSRSKSIIMSNRNSVAKEYGASHFCFPKWDAELAETDEDSDLIKQQAGRPIMSYFGMGVTIEQFSMRAGRELRYNVDNLPDVRTTPLDEFKEQFNKICETEKGLLSILECFNILPESRTKYKQNLTAEQVVSKVTSGDFFEFLSSYFMTPESVGISLTNNYHFTKKAAEIWTESECLIIPFHDMVNLLPELKKHININERKFFFDT